MDRNAGVPDVVLSAFGYLPAVKAGAHVRQAPSKPSTHLSRSVKVSTEPRDHTD